MLPLNNTNDKGFGPRIQELPCDMEAEQALLGSILIGGDYSYDLIDEIGDRLKAEYFYYSKHQQIYSSIIELWTSREPIDPIHVLDNLRRRGDSERQDGIDNTFLVNLMGKSTLLSNPKETVKIIKSKYLLRKIIGLGEEMKLMGFRQEQDAEQIMEAAQRKLYELSLGSIEKNFVKIDEIIKATTDNIFLLHEEGGLRGVPTGFYDLDEKLGGLQNSDMIIVACRPSMGKTALSLSLAKKVAMNGIPVAFFSLEMSSDQLCERLLSSVSGIDLHKIRSGNIGSGQESESARISRISESINAVAELPIWIDDTGGASMLEIRSKARRMKHRHNIGLIIIDYLQLMTSGNERAYAGNRVQEVADISRNLKILAKDLNVPVIALSQLSRRVEGRDDKRPILSDLRESGSIEQDADVVMFIHREDYYNKDLPPEKAGKAEIIIAKNRNGETGQIELQWNKYLATFENLHNAKMSGRIEK
jgi:replicative DNA helicase